MKLILAREEGEGWKAYVPGEDMPEGAETKEVDTDLLASAPNDWETVQLCEAVLRKHYRHVVTSNDSDLSDVAYHEGLRAYSKQINADAEWIREDILSGDIASRDDLYERVGQEAENASMYTRAAYEILLYSDNTTYGLDDGLVEYDRKRCAGDAFITALAHWAYHEDLMERVAAFDDVDVNDKNLGRCSECDAKGYTVDVNDVVRRCGECDKYDDREEAIEAAVAEKAVKECLRCGNKSYTRTGLKGAPEACVTCCSLSDEEAQELASEDGVVPPEPDDE